MIIHKVKGSLMGKVVVKSMGCKCGRYVNLIRVWNSLSEFIYDISVHGSNSVKFMKITFGLLILAYFYNSLINL